MRNYVGIVKELYKTLKELGREFYRKSAGILYDVI